MAATTTTLATRHTVGSIGSRQLGRARLQRAGVAMCGAKKNRNVDCASDKVKQVRLLAGRGGCEDHAADNKGSPSLSERLLAAGDAEHYLSLAAVTLGLTAVAALAAVEPSHAADLNPGPHFHPVSADISQLAAQEDFWVNLTKYFRFFISLMTGTAYVILRPFAALLKKPTTAVLFVAGAVGAVVFLNFTINAMLGITDPVDYQFSPIN